MFPNLCSLTQKSEYISNKGAFFNCDAELAELNIDKAKFLSNIKTLALSRPTADVSKVELAEEFKSMEDYLRSLPDVPTDKEYLKSLEDIEKKAPHLEVQIEDAGTIPFGKDSGVFSLENPPNLNTDFDNYLSDEEKCSETHTKVLPQEKESDLSKDISSINVEEGKQKEKGKAEKLDRERKGNINESNELSSSGEIKRECIEKQCSNVESVNILRGQVNEGDLPEEDANLNNPFYVREEHFDDNCFVEKTIQHSEPYDTEANQYQNPIIINQFSQSQLHTSFPLQTVSHLTRIKDYHEFEIIPPINKLAHRFDT